MTRAIATVVSNVQTSVITTSRPMKMKLRPITLALLEARFGSGEGSVVKSISGFDRVVVKMPANFYSSKRTGLERPCDDISNGFLSVPDDRRGCKGRLFGLGNEKTEWS
jgi:hypothetical protein